MATINQITSFTGAYRFLSNFYPSEVIYSGPTGVARYRTVEHAYQAAKCILPEDAFRILAAEKPGQAKRLGRHVMLRKDWEAIKLTVMEGLLIQKFGVEPLKSKLFQTGEAELIEGNDWGDRYWGAEKRGDEWLGENHLGKLLMKIRSQI